MKSKKITGILFILAILLFSTGCATFKSEIKGKMESPREKAYGAERVSVLFIFSHYRQTKGWDAIPKMDDKYRIIRGFDDFFNNALNEFSNIKRFSTFTEFSSDVNEPERRAQKDSLMKMHDYVIKIKFIRETSFAKQFLGTLVSSVSLTLLPVPYSYSYGVSADVMDSQGRLLKSYTRSAHLTKWVQTFMLFVYPFHPEERKKEELYVEFMKDIFSQIETEKILVTSGK